MSTETVVEKTWHQLLERHPDARRGGSAGAIEAASAEPRLRQLFPFLSHGCLTFRGRNRVPGQAPVPPRCRPEVSLRGPWRPSGSSNQPSEPLIPNSHPSSCEYAKTPVCGFHRRDRRHRPDPRV
ncbi:DUF6193 family natural product biosynthesis protein, partial [Streptomyces sp. Isolate_219]|uniref:DUF6193 family natural product biosynthesis protein n=1 Tax=Streptomyces sp. Isolate_219 TaxID=2950110 RepID=UPI0021C937B7